MGTTYGKWTLVDPTDHREKVLARCKCGTERVVNRRHLISGISRSCGCDRASFLPGHTWDTHALAPDHSPAAVPGARFGRWTVVSTTVRGKKRYAHCQCDCGNQKELRTDNLLKGTSRSCGCLKVDAGHALGIKVETKTTRVR